MSVPTLVLSAGVALARALANETIHMAVGSGDSAWDALPTIPQPTTAQIAMLNETARVVGSIVYLDAQGAVAGSPTNRLRVSGSFGIGVANGTIREVGLFAFGSGIAGSGVLVAVINIGAISKPAGGGDYALARHMRVRLVS